MYICKYCGKEYETSRKLGGHVSKCKQNNNINLEDINKHIGEKKHNSANFKIYTLNCEICNKEYQLELSEKTYKLGKYKKTCSDECAKKLTALHINKEIKNKKISESSKNNLHGAAKIQHDNKLYIERNNLCIYNCEQCNKEFNYYTNLIHSKRFCCKKCSNIHKSKLLSDNAKKHNFGGYIINSGSSQFKRGYYKGIHCDSSWELAFLVYHLDNNLNINRCKDYRTYKYNDNIYKYYPDFITDKGIIEIKGYITDKVKYKINQNPDIIVLYWKDIKPYYEYAVNKYGNNFWEVLYEN